MVISCSLALLVGHLLARRARHTLRGMLADRVTVAFDGKAAVLRSWMIHVQKQLNMNAVKPR